MPDTREEWTTLPSEGSAPELRLYLARPDDQQVYPSVIVIHEAFGLDQHIQDVSRRFAAEGFVAVTPDLFWVEPFGRTVKPEEIKQVMALRSSLPPERRTDPKALEEARNRLPAEQADRLRQIMEWMGRRDAALR